MRREVTIVTVIVDVLYFHFMTLHSTDAEVNFRGKNTFAGGFLTLSISRVKKRVSEKVSLRVMHRIRSESFGKTLGETLAKGLGSDPMHDSRLDSLRDSFFYAGYHRRESKLAQGFFYFRYYYNTVCCISSFSQCRTGHESRNFRYQCRVKDFLPTVSKSLWSRLSLKLTTHPNDLGYSDYCRVFNCI